MSRADACGEKRACAGTRAGLLLCAALWLVGPTGAAAGIYKCTGPDGKTLYTSDRSACPDAKAHELKAEIQSAGSSNAPDRSPAARAASPRRGAGTASGTANGSESEAADGVIEMWRRKRPEAEARLALLKKRAAYLQNAIGGCNRGATWFAKDRAGLKHHVSCEKIRSDKQEIDREIAKLEAYLAGGLEEECRRAGCLPGWIR